MTAYSRPVHRIWVLSCVLAVTATARADGLSIVGGSPRAIGRAGTGTVGDDGGGALLINPAAIARREGMRGQVGIAFIDDSLAWHADAEGTPISRDQAGVSTAPLAAAIGSVGPWILGAGVMTAGVTDRALRDPADVLDADKLGRAFDYRYAGIAGTIRRDTVTIGIARRLGDAVAIGISGGLSRVSISERRRIWAGFESTLPPGHEVGDPSRDVELGLSAHDNASPSAVAGVLVAPTDSPVELGASVGWGRTVHASGEVTASGMSGGTTVRLAAPTSQLVVRQPLAIRAGARYLGDRFVAELGGDVWIARDSAQRATWRVTDVNVIDPSSLEVGLASVPSRISQRTHGAVRLAVDVELIAGFLWATGGYAYTVGSTTPSRLSASFGDLGGSTFALGLEGTAGGITVTLGWSRTLALAAHGSSDLRLDNPFAAGDRAVPAGTLDAAADQLGILLDVELDPP